MPLVATAKTPHPTGLVFGRSIKMKNVLSLSKVHLLDGNNLLCHCCFKFIAFLLLGVVVEGWGSVVPIDVPCLKSTLLYEMHE